MKRMQMIKKNMIKRLPLAILAAGMTFTASAQSIGDFNRKLASSSGNGSVRVTERDSAAEAVQRYSAGKRMDQQITGYRIRIFFSNSQNAREESTAIQTRFRETFPGTPVYPDHQNPYFIVDVGNFMTSEECLIKLMQIQKQFPTAFQRQISIPIEEFLKEETSEPAVDETAPESL